jgi:hypothetical protein
VISWAADSMGAAAERVGGRLARPQRDVAVQLPVRFAAIIPMFPQQRTWRHAELLLIVAILGPRKRRD